MLLKQRIALAACLAVAALAGAGAMAQPPAVSTPAVEGDAEAGAEFYSTECRGCHAVSIAPTLRGLIDRPIASVATFTGYSEGLKAKGGQAWTTANIDAFLTAPATFAPGTLMTKAVPDAHDRANVIAYIASLPPPRS